MTDFLELPDDISYQRAMKVSTNKKRLAMRIGDARYCLHTRYAKLFTGSTYKELDFKNHMLRSDCGKYALMWLPRENPYLPDSYENQQIAVGRVILFFVHDDNVGIGNTAFREQMLARLRLEAEDPVEQVEQLFDFLESLDEVNNE